MSMIWKSAMPLLTTLAALVIIVNCVEEDLEAEYRHDLRPRTLDIETPNYDQAWRAIEEEPLIKRTSHYGEDKLPEEGVKRRRPGRKRKRQPQPAPEAEIVVEKRFVFTEESQHNEDLGNSHKNTDTPKRRRKKLEPRPVHWTDDAPVVYERPLRRRAGVRKKRPSIETWPDDVGEFRQYTNIQQEPIEDTPDQVDKYRHTVRVNVDDDTDLTKPLASNTKFDDSYNAPTEETFGVERIIKPEIADDASVFSPEILTPVIPIQTNKEFDDKIEDGTISVLPKEDDKTENTSNNPITLKDILRKSNGTSLSEILQQHNLSLADLLKGKDHAVSIFKPKEPSPSVQESLPELTDKENNPDKESNPGKQIEIKKDNDKETDDQRLIHSETKYGAVPLNMYLNTTEKVQEAEADYSTTVKPVVRRRYPIGLRRNLRMRPMLNVTNTNKGYLNRNLIALNARKYLNHRRNTSKSKEWKDVLPSMIVNETINCDNNTAPDETTTITTTELVTEPTTITNEVESNYSTIVTPKVKVQKKLDDIDMDETETTVSLIETSTNIPLTPNITEIPIPVATMTRPTANSASLRRQTLNNRLKKKRQKHKNTTTEPPQDDIIKHLFGVGKLVTSSEFIAKTKDPDNTIHNNEELSNLDNLVATESISTGTINLKPTMRAIPKAKTERTTAKKELEDILNDTHTSAILSRILMERNMTLSELVEHRERGSSHVHLADIFHNASREPNPPEPFLSKSLLEPISKETYPLRAILEANLHDPNAKVKSMDSNFHNINIPVVMDFRNNVNENAENMGIMSLFHNFTATLNKSPDLVEKDNKVLEIDPSEPNSNDTSRTGRVLGEIEDDIVSWNEIFSLMGKTHNLENKEISAEAHKTEIKDDIDDDSLIMFEDLQHLKIPDSIIVADNHEKIEIKALEDNISPHHGTGILNKAQNPAKSVTVATASIAGLALILFLLTYAAFKWKQQRSNITKKRTNDERIPTPVFENRKGTRNNSSTRSISPMLQSNIYSLNTIDSQNCKSSDYMWDSLRKPFQ